MGQLDRRLLALEQREQASKGIRIFQESDTSGVFYEVSGTFYAGPQGYTRSDLTLLTEKGWQLVIAVYGESEAPNEY